METGSTIQAAVLDVSKTERLVDLSLKPELVGKWTGKSSSRQTNRKVKSNIQFSLSLSLCVCMYAVSILLLISEII